MDLEENLDANIKVIKSSTELLNILNDPNRYRFDMHVKLNKQIYRLEFRLKPLADNEYMD